MFDSKFHLYFNWYVQIRFQIQAWLCSESPNPAIVSRPFRTPSLSAGSSDPEEKTLEVESTAKPQLIIKADVVPENGVVQQEIVDMYMTSMQQFMETLTKKKLQMDLDLGNSGSKIDEEKSGQQGFMCISHFTFQKGLEITDSSEKNRIFASRL